MTISGATAPSSGSWNAEFFGFPDADGPSGIAGDFSAERPETDKVNSYQVEGAFGAQVIERVSN